MLNQTSIFGEYLCAVTAKVGRLIESEWRETLVVVVVVESEARHARV
jgi:hypothetical protein